MGYKNIRLFENVAQFKYFGMTVTIKNLIKEGHKRRLNSDNACYHLGQSRISSHLISRT
jgi:hypothetical protein